MRVLRKGMDMEMESNMGNRNRINDKNNAVDMAIKAATGTNCAMSFLVPVRKGGHILDAAFLYGIGDFSTVRMRPFASVILEPGTGSLLEYRNSYLDDFADGEKYPMWRKIDYSVPYAKSAAEQGELVGKVHELYGRIRKLAWKDALDETDKNVAAEYGGYFRKAVPKDLLPFYEALSPEFFAWLQGVSGL